MYACIPAYFRTIYYTRTFTKGFTKHAHFFVTRWIPVFLSQYIWRYTEMGLDHKGHEIYWLNYVIILNSEYYINCIIFVIRQGHCSLIVKMLLVRENVFLWVVVKISLLCVRGDVHLWAKITHEFHEHRSPTNNEDVTVIGENTLLPIERKHRKLMKDLKMICLCSLFIASHSCRFGVSLFPNSDPIIIYDYQGSCPEKNTK